MRQEDKIWHKQNELFERHKQKQTKYIEDFYERRSDGFFDICIEDLSLSELNELMNIGHIGSKTRNLKELKFFYNRVEEEIKRRKIKEV